MTIQKRKTPKAAASGVFLLPKSSRENVWVTGAGAIDTIIG